MNLHVTITDENGKRVIDDDTPLLALVWGTESEPGHSTCGSAVLGKGNGNQSVALVQTMISLCSETVARNPWLALQLALRKSFGAGETRIDLSEMLRTAKDVPDSGTEK